MKKHSQTRPHSFNRRDFLKTSALAAGAATFGFPALVRGQNLNNKLNIAFIGAGVGGGAAHQTSKGVGDAACCDHENIVALCDVDKAKTDPQLAKYPGAKFYSDYRKMFDDMGKGIDAVNIATPDHWHAIIASTAMKLGKHVYCQKPLTQTVFEARELRDMANQLKLVTQMGNQGSASEGLRRGVEVIQSGLIGGVKDIYVWSNRPIWPQGMARPDGADPVPEGFDWDMWLGPAPLRPFKQDIYHPFNWRGWLDFGTGALGDMACHTVNLPFRAAQLGYPTEIEAESSGMNGETYPVGSKIRFAFPARPGANGASLPATTLRWYDGGKPSTDPRARGGHDGSNKPPREVTAEVESMMGKVPGSGCLIIGDKGTVFSPEDYGNRFFVKLKDETEFVVSGQHPAIKDIPQVIPRNKSQGQDTDRNHHQEWITAIKENTPEICYSRFDIAAYLTEIMLLGCVSLRVGKKIEWDGPSMTAKNAPEAAHFIKRTNRAGWI